MVGFRVEFLQLNVLKDGGDKDEQVILGDVCEATSEEIVPTISEKDDDPESIEHLIIKKNTKKVRRKSLSMDDTRKRSWVWKYFNKMSNIIYRCNLCNVVLSIKGCNTNNMNRHIRSRHSTVFHMETLKKTKPLPLEHLDMTEVETPFAVKTEEIVCATEKDLDETTDSTSSGHRRSWIWMYFDRKSSTTAQCKICHRNICHGGNATGNMNRHLKIIHNKTADDYTWIWKVFDTADNDYYCCKICQHRTEKHADAERTMTVILDHLNYEHGVVSGDQIITGAEEGEEVEH